MRDFVLCVVSRAGSEAREQCSLVLAGLAGRGCVHRGPKDQDWRHHHNDPGTWDVWW